MKVADSSFLVALFLPEDINHEKAKEIFEKKNLFLVPEDVVKETLTVITYKKGKVLNILKGYGSLYQILMFLRLLKKIQIS